MVKKDEMTKEFYERRIIDLEWELAKRNKELFKWKGKPVYRSDAIEFMRGIMIPLIIIATYMMGQYVKIVQYDELKQYCSRCGNIEFDDDKKRITIDYRTKEFETENNISIENFEMSDKFK